MESKAEQETGCSNQQRAVIELEFAQSLANPHYLNCGLAQNRYFEDPAFVAYLKYLEYWCKPEYCKFIVYPHCLFFLELLQSSEFRKAVANNKVSEFIHLQQYQFWQTYAVNRAREQASKQA